MAGREEGSGAPVNNPLARLPSPAVSRTVQSKQQRFITLMQVLLSQYPRKRKSKPKLLIPVITHLGEMSPDMINLIEILTNEAVLDHTPGYMNMGRARKRVTGDFRAKLKDFLMAANARGFGRALMAAGNPMSGHCVDGDTVDIPSWEWEY